MSNDVILLVALAAPALALVVLRANAAMVFLSLCLGAVLVQYVAPSAYELMQIASTRAGEVSNSTLAVILLLAPAVVTSIVTLLSTHGRIRTLLNILPAAAASMLAVLLAVSALPAHMTAQFQHAAAWHILSNAEALVVGGGALISLFFLWSQRRSFQQHDKRHR
jgi:hypothetical protein